ncbi:hypothetical protein BKA65DRAFT_542789 [Rhexocercosporidium sp. MPI-PUGE-AT-0058]|nr:hypothetical protein BKA65DRAFT_542789 [Rhexocercosporidium sp. MPI-PUGE-AT-0058]
MSDYFHLNGLRDAQQGQELNQEDEYWDEGQHVDADEYEDEYEEYEEIQRGGARNREEQETRPSNRHRFDTARSLDASSSNGQSSMNTRASSTTMPAPETWEEPNEYPTNSEGRYICLYRKPCNKTFADWTSVKRHVRTVHMKIKDHVCDTSKKGYTDPRRRDGHITNPKFGKCYAAFMSGEVLLSADKQEKEKEESRAHFNLSAGRSGAPPATGFRAPLGSSRPRLSTHDNNGMFPNGPNDINSTHDPPFTSHSHSGFRIAHLNFGPNSDALSYRNPAPSSFCLAELAASERAKYLNSRSSVSRSSQNPHVIGSQFSARDVQRQNGYDNGQSIPKSAARSSVHGRFPGGSLSHPAVNMNSTRVKNRALSYDIQEVEPEDGRPGHIVHVYHSDHHPRLDMLSASQSRKTRAKKQKLNHEQTDGLANLNPRDYSAREAYNFGPLSGPSPFFNPRPYPEPPHSDGQEWSESGFMNFDASYTGQPHLPLGGNSFAPRPPSPAYRSGLPLGPPKSQTQLARAPSLLLSPPTVQVPRRLVNPNRYRGPYGAPTLMEPSPHSPASFPGSRIQDTLHCPSESTSQVLGKRKKRNHDEGQNHDQGRTNQSPWPESSQYNPAPQAFVSIPHSSPVLEDSSTTQSTPSSPYSLAFESGNESAADDIMAVNTSVTDEPTPGSDSEVLITSNILLTYPSYRGRRYKSQPCPEDKPWDEDEWVKSLDIDRPLEAWRKMTFGGP